MKTSVVLSLLLIALNTSLPASPLTVARADSSSLEIEPVVLAGNKLYHRQPGVDANDPVEQVTLEDLSAEGQAAVNAWASAEGMAAETSVDQPPSPLHTSSPSKSAIRDQSGLLSIGVVIDTSGSVASAFIAKSTNNNLNEPCLAAVRQWRFRPAQKDGKPVQTIVFVPMQLTR